MLRSLLFNTPSVFWLHDSFDYITSLYQLSLHVYTVSCERIMYWLVAQKTCYRHHWVIISSIYAIVTALWKSVTVLIECCLAVDCCASKSNRRSGTCQQVLHGYCFWRQRKIFHSWEMLLICVLIFHISGHAFRCRIHFCLIVAICNVDFCI